MIFDLDGVLLDSEQLWARAKEELVRAAGGRWREDAGRAMMGMSSSEWSAYMREELGVPLPAEEINGRVRDRLTELYREQLPLLPGAQQAVRRLSERWPLGLASSSNREIIDLVLARARLEGSFAVTVSSEEVARGKPAPDVYLEAARRLHVPAGGCVAIEDSSNGLLAAQAAGMACIAVPNRHFPPSARALGLAAFQVTLPGELTAELIEAAAGVARGLGADGA